MWQQKIKKYIYYINKPTNLGPECNFSFMHLYFHCNTLNKEYHVFIYKHVILFIKYDTYAIYFIILNNNKIY
jgi:hypothetical protein